MLTTSLYFLEENETHLWWVYADQVRDPALLRRQFAILSEREQQQQQRFRFEKGRHQYLVSHALVRETLSRYAPVAPAEWSFSTNRYGRPAIAEPAEFTHLRFNLSHADGMAVVALARDRDVGVDVENVTRQGQLLEIADRFFSPAEVRQLHQVDFSHRRSMFFEFWTLKEAYIKARGMGLAIPLDSFSFDLSNSANPAISFHDGCEDDPGQWQFVQTRPGPDHRISLAVRLPSDRRLNVVNREIVPRGEGDFSGYEVTCHQ